eukprot:365321-Chlamydomonas_euryale.AAC.7
MWVIIAAACADSPASSARTAALSARSAATVSALSRSASRVECCAASSAASSAATRATSSGCADGCTGGAWRCASVDAGAGASQAGCEPPSLALSPPTRRAALSSWNAGSDARSLGRRLAASAMASASAAAHCSSDSGRSSPACSGLTARCCCRGAASP